MSLKSNLWLCVRWFRENLLLVLIFLGVILGSVVGIALNPKVQESKIASAKEIAMYISFPGELFLRMLKLLILPLIISSVVVSLAVLDRSSVTKLGKRAAAYFLVTTFLAVVLGVILASTLKPGVEVSHRREVGGENTKAVHAILDLIRNMIPDNIVEAAFTYTATKYKKENAIYVFVNKTAKNYVTSPKNMSSLLRKEMVNPWSISDDVIQVIKEEKPIYVYDGVEKYQSANLLGILVFSIVFGVILSILGEQVKPLTQVFNCIFVATMKMVEISMWFSPIGISSIIAGKFVSMEDILGSTERLGMYIVTLTIGCLLHALVTLPVIYFIILRKNPFLLLIRMAKALLTAFGTGSSSATIPTALACLERNQNVDQRICQFVIPVGTTINKDGTGIYNAIAAIYIIQSQHGGSLDFGSSVLLCLAATLASFAAAPIPGSVPIVTKTIVLQAINIRSADIAMILAIDWLLTRVSTTLNVWGNCVGCVLIEHFSRKDLESAGCKSNSSSTDRTEDFVIEIADEQTGEDKTQSTTS